MVPATPNEKLNFVLNYIQHQRKYEDFVREISEWEDLKGQFTSGEIDLIMDKLRDDGYIDFVAGQKISKDTRASEGLEMRKNYNGVIFRQNGGYVQKAINDALIENQKDFRERMLLYGTWAVAVGAIGLIIWEMIKTFCIEVDH